MKSISADQLVGDLLQRWQRSDRALEKAPKSPLPVLTLSMEPGSGGLCVADKIARHFDFDLYNRDIVHRIAQSVRASDALIDGVEKERFSGVSDFISSLVRDQYLHPDVYLEHLMKVVAAIAHHGRAVIVGRGANFILPSEHCFSIRVVAPLDIRVKRVSDYFKVGEEAAKKRIVVRESRRRAFVRQAFNTNITDAYHYDLILNTGRMTHEMAVAGAVAAVTEWAKSH
jgi:cytidylate kinase